MSASTRRLTAAGAIVEFLKKQYVERDGVRHRLVNGVFGIFGHGNVTGLGQALDDYGGEDLPYLQPKNEQAMVTPRWPSPRPGAGWARSRVRARWARGPRTW